MITTATAESTASQEAKIGGFYVLPSGIVAQENTAEISGFSELRIGRLETKLTNLSTASVATILATIRTEQRHPNPVAASFPQPKIRVLLVPLLAGNQSSTDCYQAARSAVYLDLFNLNTGLNMATITDEFTQSIKKDSGMRAPHSIPWRVVKHPSALLSDDSRWTGLTLPTTKAILAAPDSDLPPVVYEFARGVDGRTPKLHVVEEAARVVQAAANHTDGPHITVDDEDGDLDFHLRLNNGLLVMANLFPDGTIDASVYDDSQGIPVKTVRRMLQSETSADDLICLFEQGVGSVGTE